MARQLLAALALLLIACSSASAQPPQLLERALGGLRWGMSRSEVQQRLGAHSIDARDTSLLRDQLAANSHEPVLTKRDPFSRSFYFFRANRLRKLYALLEPAIFPEGNFLAFVATLQQRLGAGKHGQGELLPQGVTRRWMEWRQGRTRLRAIDQTQHLGCYALMYEDTQ